MNFISYIWDSICKIKYWLIIVPLVVGIITVFFTRDMPKNYSVKTEVYTGIVSGTSSLNSDETVNPNWNVMLNAMDNLINIVTSQNTLNNVSLRLLSQHYVHGEEDRDNDYIKAENYKNLLKITPSEVLNLVDKTSEDKTFDNLLSYQNSDYQNFIYTLFNGSYKYYSYEKLSRINVKRMGVSDMIEFKYESDDPGITYHTISILTEEFIKQYDDLRFGQANNTIKFLERELSVQQEKLRMAEDSLARYTQDNRIVDYDLQAQSIVSLSEALESRHRDILLEYSAAEGALLKLESQMDKQSKQMRNNREFLKKLEDVSVLASQITRMEVFQDQSLDRIEGQDQKKLGALKKKLEQEENEFKNASEQISENKYTTEGVPMSDIVNQWAEEALRFEKARSELEVIESQKELLDEEYAKLLPHNFSLKKKDRDITFEENSYLALLNSLNAAKLKQKSLQMTSANLKTITPPVYPQHPISNKRSISILFAVICSVIFVISYFLLVEIFSRKLINKTRTERLTSQKVLGAYSYIKGSEIECKDIDQYLINSLLNYFHPEKKNIINLMSLNNGDGKSFLGQIMTDNFTSINFKVKNLIWDIDFSPNSKDYLLAKEINHLYIAKKDILIIEHPPISSHSIPESLLKTASINLVILDANTVWKDTDQAFLDNIVKKTGDVPLFIYLNKAKEDVVKSFVNA